MDGPFFAMLSTPACHAPFTPAPQYAKSFPNVTAPRNGSFNTLGKVCLLKTQTCIKYPVISCKHVELMYFCQDKHWLLRQVKHPMNKVELDYIDTTYVNR